MSTIGAQEDVFKSLGLAREAQQSGPVTDASELGMGTFLKLMVTQLNNQDPFKPMDNSAFLGQIAQFGSVTGLDKVNQQIESLAGSLTSGQALQAGSLVGHEVLVPVDVGSLQAGETLRGQVDLAQSSPDVTLRVYDAFGQLVREQPMGAAPAGAFRFSWDGVDDRGNHAPAGRYRVEVSASQGGEPVRMQPELFARVDSVSLSGADGLTLNLAGLGPVAFNNVKQIF